MNTSMDVCPVCGEECQISLMVPLPPSYYAGSESLGDSIKRDLRVCRECADDPPDYWFDADQTD